MTETIVYFVDSKIFGGNEQSLLNLLSGLDRSRWNPVLFYHEGLGIRLLIDGAKKLSIQTLAVPRMEGISTITGLPTFLKQLISERPKIFHAYQSWLLSCKYGLLAAALARVPVVLATANHFMYPPWGRTVTLQQQLVTKCVDRYIAVSKAVARQLEQTFRIPANKIRVIYNSIQNSQFQSTPNPVLKAELNRGNERPIIITVARLDWQKGHSYLLEAIRQVRDGIFLIVGDGPEKDALEDQASQLGIQDRVIFLGYREDIPELLAISDLFVLPSFNEGLPLSILEAMAAGKAVVATAVGGTPEAVVNGETGILVPPKDSMALANAIQTLLSNPPKAREMGEFGRARVERQFSPGIIVGQISQIYDELLPK